jgi:7,8-dihydropterin-6-yl-methyl-4-(beta-D-ribofuranosyl)aminobenzene 5'-phosphate synthase
MRITALLENTTKDMALTPKHGLCIHIETSKHKILFDLGPDDTYLHNAQKIGVNLAEVDTVVLSHGHYDHGGGLAGFLKINDKAKFFLHRQAFAPHYFKVLFVKKYIGLDQSLADNDRITFTDDAMCIDDELFLFSDVEGQLDTKSSRALLKKTSDGYVRDDFAHEQSLIITAEDKAVLFSGCSHRGISNILRAAYKHQPVIQVVFGGFHLCNPVTKAAEPTEVVERLATELSARETVFYTGHCTGNKAFETMSDIMGNKVQYLSTGSVIEL